jgi:hypothetical protein
MSDFWGGILRHKTIDTSLSYLVLLVFDEELPEGEVDRVFTEELLDFLSSSSSSSSFLTSTFLAGAFCGSVLLVSVLRELLLSRLVFTCPELGEDLCCCGVVLVGVLLTLLSDSVRFGVDDDLVLTGAFVSTRRLFVLLCVSIRVGAVEEVRDLSVPLLTSSLLTSGVVVLFFMLVVPELRVWTGVALRRDGVLTTFPDCARTVDGDR